MARIRFQGRGRGRPAVRAFLLLLLVTPGMTPTAVAQSSCAGARSAVSEDASSAEIARTRSALTCLIAQERRSRGLAALESDGDLRDAAVAHSRDMVRRHYFEHESPGGSTPESRIRRSGYLARARRWSVGEALAWGSGPESSAARLFENLMDSPPHRALLLDRDFRDVGIGVAFGVPETDGDDTPGLTVTIAFGRFTRR